MRILVWSLVVTTALGKAMRGHRSLVAAECGEGSIMMDDGICAMCPWGFTSEMEKCVSCIADDGLVAVYAMDGSHDIGSAEIKFIFRYSAT